jgi:hypothetical protein
MPLVGSRLLWWHSQWRWLSAWLLALVRLQVFGVQ